MSEEVAREAARPGLLLVDDDPLIRDSLSYMLRPDFDVHLAETRREAQTIHYRIADPRVRRLIPLLCEVLTEAPD
jgi:DNA-binding transcriptional ArsR family regulator